MFQWINACMHGWMNGGMDLDSLMDAGMDGWFDGRMAMTHEEINESMHDWLHK